MYNFSPLLHCIGRRVVVLSTRSMQNIRIASNARRWRASKCRPNKRSTNWSSGRTRRRRADPGEERGNEELKRATKHGSSLLTRGFSIFLSARDPYDMSSAAQCICGERARDDDVKRTDFAASKTSQINSELISRYNFFRFSFWLYISRSRSFPATELMLASDPNMSITSRIDRFLRRRWESVAVR